MAKHPGKSQHKIYAESGKLQDIPVAKPSTRFYSEGGFVKHGDFVHTTHGAPLGYSKKVGKCKGGST